MLTNLLERSLCGLFCDQHPVQLKERTAVSASISSLLSLPVHSPKWPFDLAVATRISCDTISRFFVLQTKNWDETQIFIS